MIKKIRLFIPIIFILISSVAHSAGSTGYPVGQTTQYANINYIEVGAFGDIIIQFAQNVNNPDLCPNFNRIWISHTNPFVDKYYAAALSAFINGKHIWAWVDGCQLMPWNETYPIVVNMAITN